ncbi:hypothetical protein [Spirabiliibacterium falconis]|uniref:hypothetical protein n=1 Tax=Spirabiliibacterium falconis TaxID=572023 RepID=UPI001AAE1212|nr:hypothetical protein [Spirabiliibacterium falconis]MBE2895020.1 hypothetical protein [Spirabiliibacterium falconis]
MRLLFTLYLMCCVPLASAEVIFWCDIEHRKNISIDYDKATDLLTLSIGYKEESIKAEVDAQIPVSLALQAYYPLRFDELTSLKIYLLGIPNNDVIYVASEFIFPKRGKFGVSIRSQHSPEQEIDFLPCQGPVISKLDEFISHKNNLPL